MLTPTLHLSLAETETEQQTLHFLKKSEVVFVRLCLHGAHSWHSWMDKQLAHSVVYAAPQ